MNKKLIKFQKLYRSTWDMDIYFMYEVNDILCKKVKEKVLFKNLINPKTLDEKIGKAFILSNLCNLDPWELDTSPEENKECYDEVIKLLPEILDSNEKHYLSKWLSERSVEYLKSASKIVNLEYYCFTYKGEEVVLGAGKIISIADGLADVVLPTCAMKISNNLIIIKEDVK